MNERAGERVTETNKLTRTCGGGGGGVMKGQSKSLGRRGGERLLNN